VTHASIASSPWRKVWLADESPEHQNFSPKILGGGPARMILAVANPDGAFDRAIAAVTTTTAGDWDGSSIPSATIGDRQPFARTLLNGLTPPKVLPCYEYFADR
jgi:hypothetical protein